MTVRGAQTCQLQACTIVCACVCLKQGQCLVLTPRSQDETWFMMVKCWPTLELHKNNHFHTSSDKTGQEGEVGADYEIQFSEANDSHHFRFAESLVWLILALGFSHFTRECLFSNFSNQPIGFLTVLSCITMYHIMYIYYIYVTINMLKQTTKKYTRN